MRKEVVFAILAGGIFGLIVAFGLFRANQALKREGASQTTNTSTTSVSSQLELAISAPENNSVVSSDEVTIEGVTAPQAWVVISADGTDQLVIANSQGGFEATVSDLSGGLNTIFITAVNASGDSVATQLTLAYSSEFNSSSVSESASDSATLEDIVSQKLQLATTKPIFYSGTVTDILTEGLQTKNSAGQIDQISVDADTTYADITSQTKTLKFTDLAIGDFIAALGVEDANKVLRAQRILVTSEPEDATPLLTLGTYGFDEDDSEILTTPDGTTPLTFTKTVIVYDQGLDKIKLSQIDEGAQVIAVGAKSANDTMEIRTVFVVLAN